MSYKPTVLILEPDAQIATRMADLVLAGTPEAEVIAVQTPVEGIEAIGQYSEIHLCLMELYFPTEDGLRFLSAIRARFRHVRIIIVTRYTLTNFAKYTKGLLMVRLPLDENSFFTLCQDALTTLEGMELPPYILGKKLPPDRWGDCYEAFDTGVKRDVFITIRRSWATLEEAVAFRTSAALMARASHPFVQAVYQAGEAEGRDYFCREKWEGLTLAELAATGKMITPRQAAQIINQAATVYLFWQSHHFPHSPITATEISMSSRGVIKFSNCVDPSAQPDIEGSADLSDIAVALSQVLPEPEAIPLRLQHLLLKLQTELVLLSEVVNEARLIDIDLTPVQQLEVSAETIMAQEAINLEKRRNKQLAMLFVGLFVAAILAVLGLFLYPILFPENSDFSRQMVYIPAGDFIYQDGTAHMPKPYYMDRYEVNWGQYLKFLKAVYNQGTDKLYRHPLQDGEKDHSPNDFNEITRSLQDNAPYHGQIISFKSPAFNIDWYDAQAFAKWAGKRLPTEEEWEKAARGEKGNLFPWGNTYQSYANIAYDPLEETFTKRLTYWDVNARVMDISSYGIYDMSGNVSEWTDSLINSSGSPVIRGGSIQHHKQIYAQATNRIVGFSKDTRASWLGFRCVSDSAP